MLGRRSRAATLDDIAEARNRAADTISELAEHAVSLARDAGNAARPAVKIGAEGIGNAFERAADASGKLASAVRPKKKKLTKSAISSSEPRSSAPSLRSSSRPFGRRFRSGSSGRHPRTTTSPRSRFPTTITAST